MGNTRLGQTAEAASDPNAVTALAGGLRPPRRTSSPDPEYPPELRAQKLEGDVGLAVQVDERGAVAEVTVVSPSAFAAFDQAAVEAARRAAYEPATFDGAPRPYALRFTVRFRLRKGAP